MKPEQYFSPDELDYLRGRLESVELCISVHENPHSPLKFSSETMGEMLTLQNVLKIALKLHQ